MGDISPGAVFAEAGVPLFLSIFGLFVAFVALLFVITSIRARRVVAEQASDEAITTLDKKIELVAFTSGHLSRLNGEIQEEFKLQLAETQRLQQQAADATEIAALNAEAVESANKIAASALSSVLDKRAKKDKTFQIWLAILSFIAGVAVTVVTTIITTHVG